MELMHCMRRRKARWLFLAGMIIVWFSVLFSLTVFFFWSCESRTPFPGKCKKRRKIYMFLAAIGLFPGPAHRCPIALVDSPWSVKFPDWKRNASSVDLELSYVVEGSFANGGKELPMNLLFGGNQTLRQREESFDLEPKKNIHCGFAQVDGPELIARKDQGYVSHCRFLVATGIFDNYDQPHQPSNVSRLAHKIFCFIMLADHVSVKTFEEGKFLVRDENEGNWVGMWRVIEMKSLPYDEARRNGKVPKLLLHRLFPKTRYSIWIDGKLELVADPLLILERYLWRENQSFAIAQHKYHRSVYEEADACKRRKRYARPLIDQHMEVYRKEGLQPWSEAKLPLQSGRRSRGRINRAGAHTHDKPFFVSLVQRSEQIYSEGPTKLRLCTSQAALQVSLLHVPQL
ncbi:probable hexosyltransferase MUCI70 isoform X2 [Physcomitrium patens]|uniref:probable hexosyltransferase MUCI70 isoform X2 n=1 Tax=Physcomitrium patens TaxID=3218 RepID=UPI000D177C7D|nr:uncharacterized protein LOC112285820 isoform X2 [Physcomitrium patens]|eukprot:XP_024382817.1 uncharacterized protein LOC112285820 isoform X2 [Physcomitrella patens]